MLNRATELERVLFTHDDDLLAEAHFRQDAGEPFAGVLFAHQLDLTVGQIIDDLDVIAIYSDLEEYFGRVQYLPL